MQVNKFINEVPKVDLHCHLDGSVRIETLYDLYEGKKSHSIEEFKKKVSVNNNNKSLIEYLGKFKYPLAIMQTEENLERIIYELLEDMSKENILYSEIRFAPTLHMEQGLSMEEIIESILKGKTRAEKEYNIKSNIILIGMRNDSSDNIFKILNVGKKYLGKGVVAFDLAGDEANYPLYIHEKSINLAKELGYKVTLHAGETGSIKNIKTALELNTDRIGHGIAAEKSEELVKVLSQSNIPLELCPSSNLQTKAVSNISEYPIKFFMDNNLKVTINTDNRTVSNVTLTDEYKLIERNFNLNMKDIKVLLNNSIDAAFISDAEKNKLKNKVEEVSKKYDL